jgi:hypothetical protein
MRSNRNPILRCALGEGKSGQRHEERFKHGNMNGDRLRGRGGANRLAAGKFCGH